MTNCRTTADLVAVLEQDARNVADPDTFLQALVVHTTSRRPSQDRPRWLLPALVVGVVAAVALATVWIATGHPRRQVQPAQPTGPSSALNRQLTTAETIRLVGLVNLPPGSTSTITQPGSLPGPAVGFLTSSTSVIDTARYWRVPLPYPQALSWVSRHPPAGLRPTDTSGPTGSQKQFSGYLFELPASNAAWIQANVQVGIAPASSDTTVWRVDGQATWIDPSPVADTRTGPRAYVTVAGGCPSRNTGLIGVSNSAAGLTASLLPPGSPSAALVCLYDGNGPDSTSGHAFALIDHRLLSAAEASQLAHLARAVSLAHVDNQIEHCPADVGSATVLAFSYPHGPDVALWYRRGGCGSVSNGSIVVGGPVSVGYAALIDAIHAAGG